ncbi:MAG: Xaa-Pro peptidase family protein [Planctomycetaceae bacterium]
MFDSLDDRPRLDRESCRKRQRRLLERMQQLGVDRAIVTSDENVHYLTGLAPRRLIPAAAALDVDGHCTLCTTSDAIHDSLAADDVVVYEAQWHATLRQERRCLTMQELARSLDARRSRRIGIEFSQCAGQSLGGLPSGEAAVDLDPVMWSLRRRKDSDELAMILHAVRCTERMYEVAREIIEPGICELEVYGRLNAAAVESAGEPLTGFGNDFQCGSIGGPPRRRAAQAGELYILDLGPAYRGYYADTCRTFAVDGRPTDAQLRAWEAVVSVLQLVEDSVRPGVSCRGIFETARNRLDAHLPGGFIHHLGHGFGLEPHEAPHLNPHWDDVVEEGDVLTAEPGLYAESLKAGLRLEQNYRVTAGGVERLTSFPLEL